MIPSQKSYVAGLKLLYNLVVLTICTMFIFYLFVYYQILSSFTFQMLSPFLVSSLKVPYTFPCPVLLPNPPTSASWSWHSPVLGHIIFTKPRASPPIDGQLGRPSSATYATRNTSSGGYWLVHIVVPSIGLQTPLAPWVISLATSLWALCSIQ